MSENYQRIESRESSTGAKLLSSQPRALQPIDQTFNLPGGLSEQFITLNPALVKPLAGAPQQWPIRAFLRYRFSGSIYIQTAGPDVVSLESAGMLLDAGGGVVRFGNAARLSSTTALAQNQVISFDEWLVDCSDLLSMLTQASETPPVQGISYQSFLLKMIFAFNNVGVALRQTRLQGSFQASAAQFNGYRFDKWE